MSVTGENIFRRLRGGKSRDVYLGTLNVHSAWKLDWYVGMFGRAGAYLGPLNAHSPWKLDWYDGMYGRATERQS